MQGIRSSWLSFFLFPLLIPRYAGLFDIIRLRPANFGGDKKARNQSGSILLFPPQPPTFFKIGQNTMALHFLGNADRCFSGVRLGVNDRISISISPEAIENRPGNAEWDIDNKFPAKIEEKVYLGGVSEIIIALNPTESIKAKLTRLSRMSSGELNVGEEIQVGWRKEDINSLAD